jgi:hypothetical protein
VGIVNRQWTRRSAVRDPAGASNLSLLLKFQIDSEVHSATFNMYGMFSPQEIKRPEHETDHSPTTSADVRNEWRYNSAPPMYFQSVIRYK